jgi:hypothetical protein
MAIPGAGSTPQYTHTTAGLARRHGSADGSPTGAGLQAAAWAAGCARWEAFVAENRRVWEAGVRAFGGARLGSRSRRAQTAALIAGSERREEEGA